MKRISRTPLRPTTVALAALLLAPLVVRPAAAQFDPAAFAVGLEAVATGLSQPLQVVDPGDGSGRLFVVEKTGAVRILRDGQVLDEPFLDIGDRISGGSEQGLLGLAFHPEFAGNGVFFIDYTGVDGDTRVERWRASEEDPDRADPDSATLVLGVDQPYANHNGGLVLFGPDGYLYIGLGDGGSQGDPDGNGQNLGTLLGSILRIDPAVEGDADDPAYAVPSDNPFVNDPDAMPEIWAYGLRNPWRFSFDRATGDFFVGDVGGSAYEEIDYRPAGEAAGTNFGWDIMEGPECHEPATGCDRAGLVQPVFSYPTHEFGCAVVGGYVYRGSEMPDLNGVYLFADYCSGLLWGMGRGAGGEWIVADPIETGLRISSFGEDATGELYVTDLDGGVYRIVSGEPSDLFRPAVEVDKSGIELSKVGDLVTYTIVVTNASSADSPDLVNGSIVDSLLGDLLDSANPYVTGSDCATTLATGAFCTITAERTVDANDPDPLVNTVEVHYNPAGFPNDVTASDDHEVNLFQPSVRLDKTGPELSTVGGEVPYRFLVTNTSSDDSPDLILDRLTDDALGDLTATATANGCDELAPGGTCEFAVAYTVQPGDPDPLPNRAEVHYHPKDSPNDVSDVGTHELNLFQPAVEVIKSGDTLAEVGGGVTYQFTVTNTGSPDSPPLILDRVADTVLGDLTGVALGAGCGSLAPGGSCGFTATFTIPDAGPNPLVNVVTIHYHPDGFADDIADDDDHAVEIQAPNEGCGPGFWKNHLELWTFDPGASFATPFGLSAAQMAAAGLDPNLTLEQAITGGGGGFNKLARHGVAALLNSTAVNYPLSQADVIALVQGGTAGLDPEPAATQLDELNNLGCPLG